MKKGKPDILRFILIYAVIFMGFSLFRNQFATDPEAPKVTQLSLIEEAFALEQAVADDPDMSLNKQRGNQEKAIKLFERASKHGVSKLWFITLRDGRTAKEVEKGARCKFEEIRILEGMAGGEGKGSNPKYYTRAEQMLRQMESAFSDLIITPGPSISEETVTWPATESYEGALGKLAGQKLNVIRQITDERNQSNWLYLIVDKSVALGKLLGAGKYSYALALVCITVLIKLLLFPLTRQQLKHQRDMMSIQPLVKKMQAEMKGQPQQKISQRTMALYKENNVSMTGGCLPMVVQMAVMIPMYQAIRKYEFQFTNGEFLWIGSEWSEKVWWLAENLAQFDVPLFALYLVSTMAYSLVQPKPVNPDPAQAKQQKLMMFGMPLMFGVMMWMWKWSSAFMFYWLTMNLVSLYQTWHLKRSLSADEGAKGGTGEGPAEPGKPVKTMSGVEKPKDPNARKSNRPQSPLAIPPRSSRKKRRKSIAR